jgi:hypothetical protein
VLLRTVGFFGVQAPDESGMGVFLGVIRTFFCLEEGVQGEHAIQKKLKQLYLQTIHVYKVCRNQ